MERMDTANGQGAAPMAETDRRPAREQAAPRSGSERAADDRSGDQGSGDDIFGSDVPDAAADSVGSGPARGRVRVRRVRVLLAVAATVYALDMASKALVVATMHYGAPIRVLGPVLQLDYTRNPGAAFSIGEAYTAFFTLIAVGVIVVILRLARSLFSLPWAIALGLLLGGAFGNLTDRIVRAPGVFRGWVVDFLRLPHWPIFNLADSAIVVGGTLMVLLAFRGLHPDGTDERAADRAPGGGGAAEGANAADTTPGAAS